MSFRFPLMTYGQGRRDELRDRFGLVDIGSRVRVRFGDCLFDSGTRELFREGRRVEISPKGFALLEALIESRPRALAKAELEGRLWPDAHVAGTSLPRLVNEARTAIGDEAAQPRFVRTVQRFGYAFSGPAVEVPAALAPAGRGCWLAWGPQRIPLGEGDNLLGRGPESLVPIGERRVSRRHARIVVTRGQAFLEDLGSRNGTLCNGHRIERPVTLQDGDCIGVGSAVLIFLNGEDPGSSTQGDP